MMTITQIIENVNETIKKDNASLYTLFNLKGEKVLFYRTVHYVDTVNNLSSKVTNNMIVATIEKDGTLRMETKHKSGNDETYDAIQSFVAANYEQ